MTINARVIKKPRVVRRCDSLPCGKLIDKGIPTVRIYGGAHYYEAPFAVYVHLGCALKSTDPKVVAAVNEFKYARD